MKPPFLKAPSEFMTFEELYRSAIRGLEICGHTREEARKMVMENLARQEDAPRRKK